MSVVSRVKSIMPPSSRSLHAMYHEIGEFHTEFREMYGKFSKMWAEVGMTRIMIEGFLANDLPNLRSTMSSHDKRMMMLLWEANRRQGESLEDAKRRVTSGLPQATGTTRLFQLASAQLLFEFDAFCAAHGIGYWLQSGTLLGAVRHGGFIPWDDDVDVGMLRSDIERAIELVRDDPRYTITVRYDWCVRCRQIRFRYADLSVPCFIDLFVYDPVSALGKQAYVAREAERAALEADLMDDESLLAYWSVDEQFLDDEDDKADTVRSYFDRHVQALYDAGVLVRSVKDAEGIVWAIDNVNSGVSHHTWYLIPRQAIWPLARMPFEGHDVSVPADHMRCLTDIFGDIYELPQTVGSYFDHQLAGSLNDVDVREAVERLAEQARR